MLNQLFPNICSHFQNVLRNILQTLPRHDWPTPAFTKLNSKCARRKNTLLRDQVGTTLLRTLPQGIIFYATFSPLQFFQQEKTSAPEKSIEPFLPGTQLPEDLLSPQSVASILRSTMTQQGYKRCPGLTCRQAPGPCPSQARGCQGRAKQDL